MIYETFYEFALFEIALYKSYELC